MKKTSQGLILFALIAGLISCSGDKKSKPEDDVQVNNTDSSSKTVNIMTFNVENLFDTKDDKTCYSEDKRGQKIVIDCYDEAFLPLAMKQTEEHKKLCYKENCNYRGRQQTEKECREKSHYYRECMFLDWSPSILDTKMLRLSEAIRAANDGKGPDILVLQEVEHKAVLETLRTKFLSDLGYNESILIEGPGKRGIDVAMMSRLKNIEENKLRWIPLEKGQSKFKGLLTQSKDTRGILKASFELPGGQPITVFALHFPSQGAHTYNRQQTLRFLNKMLEEQPNDRLVIATGDFNITTGEEDQKKEIFRYFIEPFWQVSHREGLQNCGENCKGTTYYDRDETWSFFDFLLVSHSRGGEGPSTVLPGSWKANFESVKIENTHSAQRDRYGRPLRFNKETGAGVSDHWPVSMNLVAP